MGVFWIPTVKLISETNFGYVLSVSREIPSHSYIKSISAKLICLWNYSKEIWLWNISRSPLLIWTMALFPTYFCFWSIPVYLRKIWSLLKNLFKTLWTIFLRMRNKILYIYLKSIFFLYLLFNFRYVGLITYGRYVFVHELGF